MTTLKHPRVASVEMTCDAYPEQYEGQLADGRRFYFRYRWGWASLGLGATEDEAVDDSDRRGVCIGDGYQGQWYDDDLRDATFAALLQAAETGA